MKYDFLIVGAGLFGATFAHEMKKKGKRCLVIDRRPHIGGNAYTENIEGINVHKYGAHIFHTDNERIWNYINQFAEFNDFVNSPLAKIDDEIYNLPFNMNTFNKLWNVSTPEEAKEKIKIQTLKLNHEPTNIEEYALSTVGKDIYEKLIKGYTEKQWGRSCSDLPVSIIKRLPLRFTYDNNYFNSRYQGIPKGGYTKLVEKMLDGIDVELNCDFFKKYKDFKTIADKLVFTGMIDEFYGYCFGPLEYRSLKFKESVEDIKDYQNNAVVNYTGKEVPYTRIIEHKHFEFGMQPNTIISKEYPCEWEPGKNAYYPISDENNEKLYKKYQELAAGEKDVIFGGRLGEYKYYNMDETIASSIKIGGMVN